jgi:hypothetical protein
MAHGRNGAAASAIVFVRRKENYGDRHIDDPLAFVDESDESAVVLTLPRNAYPLAIGKIPSVTAI